MGKPNGRTGRTDTITTIMTTEQDMNRNPTGIGGFGDNPQNINRGGKPKNVQRFDYWMTVFKDMTYRELKEYTKARPLDDMYMAEAIAYQRVIHAMDELQEFREVADRTEGKAPATIVHEGSVFSDKVAKVVLIDDDVTSEQEAEAGD